MTEPIVFRSSAPPTDVLPRGTSVGRYVIIDTLGQGGMGVVYAAYDTQLDRKIAIKVLRPEFLGGADTTEIEARLLREAQAMARLTHPNVVAIHDVGTYEGRVFLAMELVDGVTMKKWLKTPHPLRERLRAMRDAGRGLAAAHASGLIHRDFKPDNILVAKDGRVVVVDFGLARADSDLTPEAPLPRLPLAAPPSSSGSLSSSLSAPLTLTGSILGTVGYIAPEQAFGEAANAATDQFSFAATLYTALYGEKPFPDTTIHGYLEQTLRPPKEPSKGKDVPSWLRRIALRGLAYEAKDRWPSMDAMLAALESDPTVLRRKVALGLGAACVVAASTFALARGVHQREIVCVPDPAELRGVWDDGIRSSVVDALRRSGAEGTESAPRVVKALDDFAGRWSDMHADVCRATRLRKEQSEDVAHLRNDCLDRERMALKSLGSVLANADGDVAKHAMDLAYGVPQVAWCGDVETLRASAGLPDDPGMRAKVLAVRAKLAESDAESLAGRLKDAEASANEAITMARATKDDPAVAEATLSAGEVLRFEGSFSAAVPLLREAFLLADGAHVDTVAVRAAGELVFVVGAKLQRADEARLWLDLAKAGLKRVGGNERLELDILASESNFINEVEWRPDLAIRVDEKIAAGCRHVYGVHPKTSTALYNLGVSWSYLGQPARALPYLEEAASMEESVGGANYENFGISEYMVGQMKVELGDTQAGDDLLRRSIAISERNGADYWAALASQALTWSALAQGDVPAALQDGEQALSLLDKAARPSVLIPIVNVPAAAAFVRAGRAAEALGLCDQALSQQEAAKSIDAEKAYGWDALRCKGEALLALGRSREAVPHLERSLTVPKRMLPGDYARAEFALARALAASHGDLSRATGLAKRAREELAAFPFLSFELREVEAWLAANAPRVGR
ncbi:MAG TPA: serine/threonine-protein kinase [Polyangiaceae bacterium]